MMHFFSWKRALLTVGVVLAVLGLAWVLALRPSHDRAWEPGQEELPSFVIEGDQLRVENFRDFQWTGETEATARYETRFFDLASIRTLDVFISHFDDFEGLAHIFLSFGFADGEQLVVSAESRRETHEDFSPLLGVLRQYEFLYVVGSEEDIVGVRTTWRGERVYRYPTIATPDQARALLLHLGGDINELSLRPRFYNTFSDNCTNALTRRVEDIAAVEFPLTWKTVLPGYFDQVLYDMKLIERTGDFAATKEAHRIVITPDPRGDRFSEELRQSISVRLDGR